VRRYWLLRINDTVVIVLYCERDNPKNIILELEGNITMNIQIFGTKKCNDTKKAERFFKERGIKYQFVDMKEKGMSKGEFNSVAQANGGLENMINWDGKDKDLLALIKYIADEDKLQKVMENPSVIKTPVVRNGKLSTLGYQPEIWKKWQ
jgi:arsenate reductase-like glutaredoxin family protein